MQAHKHTILSMKLPPSVGTTRTAWPAPVWSLLMLWLTASALFSSTVQAAGYGDSCSSSKNVEFRCPNVDECPDTGISLVSSCSDCPGHLSAFKSGQECFDRKLLSPSRNPSPQFFYRDLIGIVVWFLAAGVATACGVGGGGIYVPLGILLLAFAPKSSSGLSQASIFGASLGGLLLNIRNKHPFTFKVKQQQQQQQNTSTSTDANSASNKYPSGVTTETILSLPTADNTPESSERCHYYTRPLIDYDMAMFLAPMEMAGAVLGVVIQTVLPNWLYLMIASVILGFTAYKTYSKWWETRNKEQVGATVAPVSSPSQQQQQPQSSQPNDGQDQAAILKGDNDDAANSSQHSQQVAMSQLQYQEESRYYDTLAVSTELTPETGDNNSGSDERQASHEAATDETETVEEENLVRDSGTMDEEKIARRNYLLERDARQHPKEKLFVFCVLWAGLTLLTFFKGGKGVDSIIGVNCGNAWYSVLIAIQFLWTFGFAAYFGRKLIEDTKERQSVGYPYHSQDVVWDFQKTKFYAFFTFLAGVVAGLIGIGGGMILGPLMLIMGIHPRVSTATTATMIVLTSSSVAVLFVISGLVPWEYAMCFFCVCLCGSLIGKTTIDGYVKKTGKASVLIFLLACIIAFATIGTLVINFTRLADANWCFAGFNQYCSISGDDAEFTCAPSTALEQSFFVDVVSVGPK